MPRSCTICRHPDRASIDQMLVNRKPFRDIAGRVGLSKSALVRHFDDHLPELLAQAKQAAELAQAEDLLLQVRILRGKAIELLKRAEAEGDYRTALQGIREARACVELLLEVQGELDRRPQINVLVSPEWLTVRTVLLGALAAYPEARTAVATALLGVEHGNRNGRAG
jgi:hypothetical protein